MSRSALTAIHVASPHPMRWLRVGAVVATACALALIVSQYYGDSALGTPAVMAAVALVLLLRVSIPPVQRALGAGSYAAREGGIVITPTEGAPLVVDRTSVRSVEIENGVLVVQRRDGTALHGSGDPLVLSAIADDLGFAPKLVRRVATLSLYGRTTGIARVATQIVLAILGLFLVVGAIATVRDLVDPFNRHHVPLSAAILAAIGLASTLTLTRGDVRIGADGLVYRKLLRRRFVAFEAIAELEREDDGVTVVLRSGRRIRFRPAKEHTAFLERELVTGTKRQRASATQGVALDSLLDRRGRDAQTWRDALEKLLANPGGYRAATLARKDLVRVLEDGGAPPERRVAAALALRVAGTRKARQRVLTAARTSADDDLRIALEAAAEGELADDALARAVQRRG